MDKPDKPLAGKRIVVTREKRQAVEFVAQLESFGADVLLLPTITFAEPLETQALDRALEEMDKFDWIVFTSRNSVRFLMKRLKTLETSGMRLAHLMLTPQVAIIGAATCDEAQRSGFIAHYEAEESRGEALAMELSGKVEGKRVFLPRSDRADPALPRMLREAGAHVADVVAYRTVSPASLDSNVLGALRTGNVDALAFFSPSAYEFLVDEIGLEPLQRYSAATMRTGSGNIAIASIGPTTSKAIGLDGLQVAIEASTPSAAALADAIVTYFRQQQVRGATT